MKLYTRTGDGGQTGLYGAERVSKTHPRVEAYGSVDELNSVLGLARAHNTRSHTPQLDVATDLEYLQNALFDVGADLATRDSTYANALARMDAGDVSHLEAMIDRYQSGLPELKHFIHPSGTPVGASLHVARSVARRAERDVLRLGEQEAINTQVVIFLNRLSDLLFVMARAVNTRSGLAEEVWQVGPRRKAGAQ